MTTYQNLQTVECNPQILRLLEKLYYIILLKINLGPEIILYKLFGQN